MEVFTTSNELYFKDPSGTDIYLVPVTSVQGHQADIENSQVVGVPRSIIVDEDPSLWSFERITQYVTPDPVESHNLLPHPVPPLPRSPGQK